MEIPEKTVWRHNPLDGIGYRKKDGSHIYNTPPMDRLMEPLIFARTQRVTCHADFEFTAAESHLYIDDDFNIDSDDTARFIAFLRRPGTLLGKRGDIVNSRRRETSRGMKVTLSVTSPLRSIA